MNYKKILHCINNWFVFFFLAAFVVTCCTMLFITTLSESLDITFTEKNISAAAKLTFGNVILISLIFTIIDAVRRKLMIDRPTKRIISAGEKITDGNFSVRIEPLSESYPYESFNSIISCFNKMAEELSSVETLRTDFIANVSHELKTPLAVMQNYGTMLQSPVLSDEKRIEYAKGITDNSRRLASLITNILKLNKLENQQIFPVSRHYDLSEQLCQSLLQFEEIWEQKNIEISADIEDGIYISSESCFPLYGTICFQMHLNSPKTMEMFLYSFQLTANTQQSEFPTQAAEFPARQASIFLKNSIKEILHTLLRETVSDLLL